MSRLTGLGLYYTTFLDVDEISGETVTAKKKDADGNWLVEIPKGGQL